MAAITRNPRPASAEYTGLTDLDSGARTFTPNALGEIVTELDAKGQTRTFGFDTLGRLTSRTDNPEGTSTFTFGTSSANHNVGRRVSMSGTGYSESYTYDGIGRLSQRTITSDATYLINLSYNSIGALDTLTYPTSTSSYRLKLKYEYQNAELLRVKDFNAPTTVFRQANSADPWGHITDETLGNGAQTVRGFDLATGVLDSIFSQRSGIGTLQDLSYEWNAVGSLTKRQDDLQGRTESLFYDNLHRLTSTTGADPMTLAYDMMGNITSKTGIGTYTYHATRKHQATATSGGTLAPAQSYAYDANGNMNSRNGSTLSWYSYDLPNTISAPGSNSSQFFYAPDRSRWKQIASYGGTSEQTIYIGGLIEKVTLSGVTSWKHYIAGSNGPAAVYIRRSTGTNETDYVLKDHLGSTDVVLNSSGAVMSRLSFDPWGRRRDGATWTGNPTSGEWTTITNSTRRGFTFHEALDNLGLVHMNGRVYDPVVARFLSADPIVQAPAFSQSFNRYSYTFNNPLSFVDPSGYEAKEKQKKLPINPNEPLPNPGGREPYDPNTITGNFGGLAGGGGNMDLPWPNVPSLRHGSVPDPTAPRQPRTIAGPGSTVSTVGGLPPGVPDWASTSGICLGGCHGTTPDATLRPMTTTERLVLDGIGIVVTAPLGGEFIAAVKAGVAARGAAAGGRALVPAVDAVYAIATERLVAGYKVWGTAGRVGSTYNVNILGLYATEGSQGLRALVAALRAEATAAGASRISIQGLAIVNEGLAGLSARVAARFGLQLERVNGETIILSGGL